MSRRQVVEKLGGRELRQLLPTDFRREFGLAAPGQYGMVCADVKQEINALESLGCSTFIHAQTDGPGWTEYGERKQGVRVDMAMGYTQAEQIELLGPGSGTDFYRDAIPQDGALTLHHVCCFQNNLDELKQQLPAAGYDVVLEGGISVGPLSTMFAYFDARPVLGIFLEVTQYRLFGRHLPPGKGLITALARLQRRFS